MTTSDVLQMVEIPSMIVVSLNLKFSQIFPKDKTTIICWIYAIS